MFNDYQAHLKEIQKAQSWFNLFNFIGKTPYYDAAKEVPVLKIFVGQESKKTLGFERVNPEVKAVLSDMSKLNSLDEQKEENKSGDYKAAENALLASTLNLLSSSHAKKLIEDSKSSINKSVEELQKDLKALNAECKAKEDAYSSKGDHLKKCREEHGEKSNEAKEAEEALHSSEKEYVEVKKQVGSLEIELQSKTASNEKELHFLKSITLDLSDNSDLSQSKDLIMKMLTAALSNNRSAFNKAVAAYVAENKDSANFLPSFANDEVEVLFESLKNRDLDTGLKEMLFKKEGAPTTKVDPSELPSGHANHAIALVDKHFKNIMNEADKTAVVARAVFLAKKNLNKVISDANNKIKQAKSKHTADYLIELKGFAWFTAKVTSLFILPNEEDFYENKDFLQYDGKMENAKINLGKIKGANGYAFGYYTTSDLLAALRDEQSGIEGSHLVDALPKEAEEIPARFAAIKAFLNELWTSFKSKLPSFGGAEVPTVKADPSEPPTVSGTFGAFGGSGSAQPTPAQAQPQPTPAQATTASDEGTASAPATTAQATTASGDEGTASAPATTAQATTASGDEGTASAPATTAQATTASDEGTASAPATTAQATTASDEDSVKSDSDPATTAPSM